MKRPYLLFALFVLPTLFIALHAQELSYTVTTRWLDGMQDSLSVGVQQSGNKAIAMRPESNKLVQFSNPEKGILSARANTGFNLPVVVKVIGDVNSDDFKEGQNFEVPMREAAHLKSISYSIKKGDDKKEINGYEADHHILTVKLEWSFNDGADNEVNAISEGSSDLYTTTALPFSWLPYTLTTDNHEKAAVPLSFLHPNIAAFLLKEHADKLSKLGLLLKARSENQQSFLYEPNPVSNTYVRELEISNVQQNAAVSLEFPNLPVLSESQFLTAMGFLMISGEFCREQTGEAGSIAVDMGADEVSVKLKGDAILAERDGNKGFAWFTMGKMGPDLPEAENGCMMIAINALEPQAVAYTLTTNKQLEWEKEPSAVAAFMTLEGENITMHVLEQGTFQISKKEESYLGMLEGTGWSLNMSQEQGTLIENTAGTFELMLAMPEK